MIRINLLPPEIIQKRRFEQRRIYLVLAGLLVFAVIGMVYVYAAFQVGVRATELQNVESQAASYRAQAEAYKVFETKRQDLAARQAVAEKALADRITWGRVADELSLVLPEEMWIERLQVGEEIGLKVQGWSLDDGTDQPDSGHKAIAKLLVRLATLEQLYDVWLTSSEKTEYEGDPAITWQVTSKVRKPSELVSATPAPAPPLQPVNQ